MKSGAVYTVLRAYISQVNKHSPDLSVKCCILGFQSIQVSDSKRCVLLLCNLRALTCEKTRTAVFCLAFRGVWIDGQVLNSQRGTAEKMLPLISRE